MKLNNTKKLYKLGIIGDGEHFNRNILPIIKKLKFIKITGYLKFSNRKKSPIHFKKNHFFKNNFDFVYISTPNKLHEKYILKSLKMNFHTLCEKPILTSSKNLKKIRELTIKNNLLLFECFMFKYHSVFDFIMKKIKSNFYGKPQYLVSEFTFPSLHKDNNRYKKKLGGGFIFDIVSYFISFELSISKYFSKIKIVDSIVKRNKIPLRGFFKFDYLNFQKFYFWGERQKYKNNLEIFFKDATVYIPFFYSKPNNLNIKVSVFKKNKIQNFIFKNENQFHNMFLTIIKNYKKKRFRLEHLDIIEKQTKFLEKILNHK